MRKLIVIWVVLMVAGVFTAGCTYVAFQQTQRDSANQPALVVAQQTVYQLGTGLAPGAAVPATTDLRTTTVPFAMVFNAQRHLVATSGGDATVTYPSGCFDAVDRDGIDRVTWQLPSGLRFATVALPYSGGYVVGAYSLRESEANTDKFTAFLAIGCGLYALGTAVVLGVIALVGRRSRG